LGDFFFFSVAINPDRENGKCAIEWPGNYCINSPRNSGMAVSLRAKIVKNSDFVGAGLAD